MKNFKKICLALFVFTLFSLEVRSQISPGGFMDTVYDRLGNKYPLTSIKIPLSTSRALPTSCGYFDLYFEAGSGFEDVTNPTHVLRRNVLCQLLNDLTQFIVSPNPNVRVSLWVRDFLKIDANAATSSILAVASPFVSVPYGAPAKSGIADGEIWKTLNSGVNSYTNLTSPLVTQGGLSGGFYHGIIAFNFYNLGVVWHTDLTTTITTPPATNEHDMYSLGLHEMLHSLGVFSLLQNTGVSILGANQNYFTRYDMFLRNSAGLPLITNNNNACALYQFHYNPALNPLNDLVSGGACNTAVSFNDGGPLNMPVLTPATFKFGSSLCHLRDDCHNPPHTADTYYAVSAGNLSGAASLKRFPQAEERQLLCDLGYRVNPTYGVSTNVNLNYINYNVNQCTGIQVAGINDGINTNATFTWPVNTNAPITINYATLLANDRTGNVYGDPTATVSCLEEITSLGVVTTTGTSFTFTAGATSGLALLRYIPVFNGQKGNITYVYISIVTGNCPVTACNNLIPNGGFETGNCNSPSCWRAFSQSPDFYGKNCGAPAFWAIPPNNFYFQGTINTYDNPNANNNHFAGITGGAPCSGSSVECIQIQPVTPLQTGVSYTLSFWAYKARYNNAPIFNGTIEIAGMQTPNLAGPSDYNGFTPDAVFVPAGQITIPDDQTWHYYTVAFQSNLSINNILFAAPLLNCNAPGYNNPQYLMLDDVSLTTTASAVTFTPPAQIALGQNIADLLPFAAPQAQPPNGTFSGLGVTLTGTVYGFNSITAGPGIHTVFYTYTAPNGCVYKIPGYITVQCLVPIVTASSSTIYAGQSTQLNATPTGVGLTYSWAPITGLSSSVIANPTATPAVTTTYIVTVTDATGCSGSASIVIKVLNSCNITYDYVVPAGGANTSTFFGGLTTITGKNISVLGTLTVTNTITFSGCNVSIAPNVKIDLTTGDLTLNNKTHLFSCTELWDGIYVPSGRTLAVNTESLIEDAQNAIVSNNGGVFTVNTAIFNKDVIGIKVNAFANNHPGTVINSVFTSRVLATAPTVASLKGAGFPAPAMVLNNNTKTTIIGTYSDAMNNPKKRMHIGIQVNNVGSASVDNSMNLVSPIGGLTVGDAVNAGNTNLFDNANFGIYANNSNITVKNNQFQYITASTDMSQCAPSPCYNPYGYAVYGLTTTPPEGGGNTAWVGGPATYPCTIPVDQNIFYECGTAVNLTDYGKVDVYSNQISNTTNLFPNTGYGPGVGVGIVSSSKRSAGTNILYNQLTNVSTGINVNITWYIVQSGSVSIYTLLQGPISITQNTLKGNVQPTDIVAAGIIVKAPDAPTTCGTCSSYAYWKPINITGNMLTAVSLGMNLYKLPNANIGYNTIDFKTNAGTGILTNLCDSPNINFNTVQGAGSGTQPYINKTGWIGINEKLCTNYILQCNTISKIGRCIVLEGVSFTPGITIRGNSMDLAYDGLVFRNGARTGVQGTSTFSNANIWGPAANFSRSQTYVEGSPTTPIVDAFWVKSGTNPTQNPTLNLASTGNTVFGTLITTGTSYQCTQVGSVPCPPPFLIKSDPKYPGNAASVRLNETVIYPNPFTNEFTAIYDGDGEVTIAVMDLLGKVVITQQGNAKQEIKIKMNDLPSGLYLVKIVAEGNTVMKKIIKE